MKNNSVWWTVSGVIALLGGILALFNPFAASLAVEIVAGWAFIVLGIACFVAIFQTQGAGNKVWAFLFSIAAFLVGFALIAQPMTGLMTLTAMVGILIAIGGIARLIYSFDLKGTKAFWPLFISGVVSILLAVMIFANYPQSAISILGIFLGVELIFSSFALFSLGNFSKKLGSLGSE